MQNKTPEERTAIAKKAHATARARRQREQQAREDAVKYAGGLREEIADLESKLSALHKLAAMNTVHLRLTNKSLLTGDEISALALPWETTRGVYFLLDGSEVVYVGQSDNVFARIEQHAEKQFDRYAYVPCEAAALDALESLYVHTLRPKLNGRYSTGELYAPIAFDKLICLVPNV